MSCATSIPALTSSQLAAAASIGLLEANAFYYITDEQRVAVADSAMTYHRLSDDGSGVELIPGVPGSYVPGQGRQFGGAGSTYTPTANRLHGIMFAHRSTFAGLGLFVATPGSADSVARVGIYLRDRNGRVVGLKEEIGEFPMNSGGQIDFLYAGGDRFIDYGYCAGIVFGGTTMPAVASHTASAEESARIWGNSDCQGPNPPFSGVYAALPSYPASLPDPFPTPYTVAAIGLGLGAKIA